MIDRYKKDTVKYILPLAKSIKDVKLREWALTSLEIK